jgi:Ser/Thr protein kinase RdoA (MazF antagonist)
MKPFNELTHLGKIQTFRRLARTALDMYGLTGARFRFVRLAGNVVFRVYASTPDTTRVADSLYEEGQYLLRIHDRSEQPTDAIKLEMEWLAAICRDTRLPVPEPIPTPNGNLLVQLLMPETSEKRDCTLLRWVKGRRITRRIKPHHYSAQGQLMAQLHNYSAGWKPPGNLTKRSFDWKGLFQDDAGAGLPNSEAWNLLPRRCVKTFRIVARKVKKVMDEWGRGSDVYGLIHGDCGVDANVLFWKGKARVIDFDGSGFGYYLYDLALALEHCWDDAAYLPYRDALLAGYSDFRVMPEEQLEHMDLFLAAFYVYMSLWTAAVNSVYPDSKNGFYRRQRWQDRGLRFIEHRLINL